MGQQRLDIHSVDRATRAVLAMETYVRNSWLDPRLYELVKIRASQLNSYAFCLDMHNCDARRPGEDQPRRDVLAARREAPDLRRHDLTGSRRVARRSRRRDGQLTTVLTLTLSIGHRMLDGAI